MWAIHLTSNSILCKYSNLHLIVCYMYMTCSIHSGYIVSYFCILPFHPPPPFFLFYMSMETMHNYVCRACLLSWLDLHPSLHHIQVCVLLYCVFFLFLQSVLTTIAKMSSHHVAHRLIIVNNFVEREREKWWREKGGRWR